MTQQDEQTIKSILHSLIELTYANMKKLNEMQNATPEKLALLDSYEESLKKLKDGLFNT